MSVLYPAKRGVTPDSGPVSSPRCLRHCPTIGHIFSSAIEGRDLQQRERKTLWKRLHSRGKQIMDDLRNAPWNRLTKDLAEKTRSGLISLMNR